MNSPFKYGKIVTGKSFINRTEDIKRIRNNIAAGINTVLISPRRWGKSSLIKQLDAMLAGETMLTSSGTMKKYKLGTPRNVSKNKTVLQEKDIVEIHGKTILFNDPGFEYWLKQGI